MIEKIQKELGSENLDGWLLYDFHQSNLLACRFLKIPENMMTTRRMFYWIPAKGDPVKIIHKIESNLLDHWIGEKREYFSYFDLKKQLSELLKDKKTIAMEYSPEGKNPYASKVDGGVISLIQTFDIQIKSSENILAKLFSVLSEKQIQSHKLAAQFLDQVAQKTWDWIVSQYKKEEEISEYFIQQFILDQIEKNGFVTQGFPICAIDENTADPHYQPQKNRDKKAKKGSLILIDLWCKSKDPGSIFADITRMATLDSCIEPEIAKVYQIVREAQRKAVQLIEQKMSKGLLGSDVDRIAREYITQEGYGDHFLHRLGHSIDEELHGFGTHLDSLEIIEERKLLPGTCCSIEPGIYLKGRFGIRQEHDLVLTRDGAVLVTGGVFDTLLTLLK